MFFAVFKDDASDGYQDISLKGLHEQLSNDGQDTNDLDFYKGTKIEVREIPSRLELVPEVKKPAPVRKPVVKSKK